MTRSNVAFLQGSKQKYSVHPDAKRYTMRDNAFIETKNGNFQYERILSTTPNEPRAPKLKISVSKNFNKLKIDAVTANGRKKVNLYANDQFNESRELAEFYLNDFVDEKILIKENDEQ